MLLVVAKEKLFIEEGGEEKAIFGRHYRLGGGEESARRLIMASELGFNLYSRIP